MNEKHALPVSNARRGFPLELSVPLRFHYSPEKKERKPTWPDRVGEGCGVGRVEVVEYGKADSKKGKTQEDDADTLELRKPIPNFRRTRATDALLLPLPLPLLPLHVKAMAGRMTGLDCPIVSTS